MPIQFSCACGRQLNAPDTAAGRRARCPNCGAILTVPAAAAKSTNPYEYELAPAAPPPPRPQRTAPAAATPTLAARPVALPARITYTYLVLLLALLPLIIFTFIPRVDIDEHFARTFAAHPELPNLPQQVLAVAHRAEDGDASEEDIFKVLPADRFDGALFARSSELHWALALGAAALWMGLVFTLFPASRRCAAAVIVAAVFTASVGVLSLLAFQYIAAYMPIGGLRFGRIGIVLLIIKLIGYSYAMAEGDHGVFLSFLGFTCGVGLCEEITKALPLLWRVRGPGEGPKWDELLVIGLASGIGFGIAEGIMYSGRYYNGIEGGGMYAVRFISCVVLHAFWAGAVAITMYNHQEWLEGADNGWTYCFNVARIVLVPMCLHGMYDTLLKQQHDAWALLVAVATFGWFAYQVERMKRAEPGVAAQLAV